MNLKFDSISDGGCTREEQIALSLKRHLFPHGGREPKAFWICFSRVHPPSEIKSNFKFKTLKRHLLKRHLTLSDSTPRNRIRPVSEVIGNSFHLTSEARGPQPTMKQAPILRGTDGNSEAALQRERRARKGTDGPFDCRKRLELPRFPLH